MSDPWRPVAKAKLIMSVGMRYRMRPSAKGWAVYDYALGERVSDHRSKNEAIQQQMMLKAQLKAIRDSARVSA